MEKKCKLCINKNTPYINKWGVYSPCKECREKGNFKNFKEQYNA